MTSPTPTIRTSKHTPNSPLAILAIILWLGAIGLVTLFSVTLLLPTPKMYKIVLSTVLIILSFLPLPKNDKQQKLGWIVGDWIMRRAREYFGLTVHLSNGKSLEETAKVHCKEGKGGVIVALEPHDVLPYPLFAFNSCLDLVPELPKGNGLMTSIVFKIPFVRHIYVYCRAGDVSRKNFARKLKEGCTVVFIPGGVQEVILLGDDNPNEIILYLKKRKGFVKLALEHGSSIVPAFSFGVDGSYGFYIPKGRIVEKIGRAIGFLPMLFWGRWGFPLGFAKPKKISMVVGEAIEVGKNGKPGKPIKREEIDLQEVERVHNIFCEKIVELFESHKEMYGYGERTLKIM